MSTGNFVNALYQNGLDGAVHPCRVQPETLTADIGGTVNAAAAGPQSSNLRAFSSERNRRGAVNMRKIGFRITAGGDNGYLVGSVIYIPVFQPANLAAMLIPANQTVSYNGATGVVVGSSPERVNP